MKSRVPTNLMWFYGVTFLIAPFVLSLIVDLPWIIRLGAVWALEIGACSFFLFFGLSNGMSQSINENAPLVKRYGKRRIVHITRMIFTVVGVLLALVFPSQIKDIAAMVRAEAPLTKVGMVAHKSGSALGGIFSQDIIFDEEYSHPENTFEAWYFPPRFFMVGNSYEIRYLPHTHMILHARLLQTETE